MVIKSKTLATLMLGALLATLPDLAVMPRSNSVVAQTIAQFSLPDTVPSGTKVRVDGDESMAVVSESLKQAYLNKFAGTEVELATSGSEAALSNLLSGGVDIAATGRSLSDDEKSQGLNEIVLDREKIAIVVSEENSFDGDIGYEQFAKIFRGEIADWSELGGTAGPIRFVDRPDSSDTRQSLSTYPVFQGSEFAAGATAEAVAEDNTAAVVKSLGADGVGYAIYSQVKDLPGIKVIPMHKVLPDNPAYPYSQPRVFVYKGEPSEAVQSFLGLATAPVGEAAVAAAAEAEAAAVAEGQDPTGDAAVNKLTGAELLAQGDAAADGDAADGDAADGDGAAAATDGTDAEAGADAADAGADGETADASAEGDEAAAETEGADADTEAAEAVADTEDGETAADPEGADAAASAEGEGAGVDGAATDAAGADGAAVGGDGTTLEQGDAAGADATGETADAKGKRGGFPLKGLLPLVALAAGGGLLWWLAAAKDDEEEEAFVEGSSISDAGSLNSPSGGSVTGSSDGATRLGTTGASAGAAAADAADTAGSKAGLGLAGAAAGAAGLAGAAAAGIKGAATGAVDKAGDAAAGVKDAGQNVVGNVTDKVGDVTGSVGDAAGNVGGKVGDAAGGIGGKVTGAAAGAAGLAGAAAAGLKGAATGAVDKAGDAAAGVKDAGQNVVGNVTDKVGDVTGAVGDAAGNVGGKVGDVTGKVGDVAGGIGGKVTDVAAGAAGSVGDAASTVTGQAGAAASGIGGTVLGAGAAVAGGAAAAAGAAAAMASGGKAGSGSEEGSIESVLTENRLFYPSEEFSRLAQVKSQDDYNRLYVQAKADPEGFWADLADTELHWFKKWDKTLEWDSPNAKWFSGGKLNITYNCLDRHLETDRRNKPAIIWEGEPGDARVLTYAQLHREVCLFANSLKKLGVGKGDVVGIYMPMVPEAAVAMLACARIGAPHSVVFGGFSAEALRDRLNDGKAKLVITADGGWRKDKIVELKPQVDKALENGACPSVENVLVVQRTRQPITMESSRDHWWHDLRQTVSPVCEAEPMDSEDVLFILYTSGSTGKPKGVVHTTGGYNLYTHMTTKWIFDLREDDVYWCTADVGWITGHSYIVYGPLSNGASSLMYEGAPRPSNPGCFWDVVEKYKVSIFYTAPTAVRAFIKMGEDLPKARDLSSLRLLGTVGEPINPEAWMWYHRVIGGERCPIVDTWWQTETGGVMITSLPGAVPTKPGSAARPFPGIIADVVDKDGKPVENNQGGYLIVRHPWPSMIRGVYGDPERFRKTYFEQVPGHDVYFAGDGARIDEDGYFWVMGRVDDVISVSGHRLGTMEIESALVSHPAVAEAAVVGRPDDLKGEEVFAFVTLEGGQTESDDLVKAIKAHVVEEIGALARPSEIKFTDALPKTRSGKIMRRLLRKVASGEEISGDTSTLENREVLDQLRSGD